jgi:hypothetical protein
MNSTRNEERANTQTAIPTGRDGAVDYAVTREALQPEPESDLPHHVYRVIELVGTSEKGIEQAIESAVSRSNETLRNLRWFEVVKTSGTSRAGKFGTFR